MSSTPNLPVFEDNEVPLGVIDGVNTVFHLSMMPNPTASLDVFRNGVLLKQGVDYTLGPAGVTFVPAAIPQPGDSLVVSFRR